MYLEPLEEVASCEVFYTSYLVSGFTLYTFALSELASWLAKHR